MLPKNEIICGDCLEVIKDWPSESIDCCVTSPPYWGLRDYGVEGQLGLEKTPEEYVTKMVEIFQEVKRVLKDEGTLWLNLGDSYNGSGGDHKPGGKNEGFSPIAGGRGNRYSGLKPKDLCGIPWRVAFALRQDGWYLRQDIIWHKPNPMPESVTDRCTKAHEYIFLLTKRPRYYYDAEVIKEDAKDAESYSGRKFRGPKAILEAGARPHSPQTIDRGNEADGKTYAKVNKRSVWTVTTKPYSEAHFATFPPDLILPCILAGCPEWVCKKCGKARTRVVKKGGGSTGKSWHDHSDDLGVGMSQTGKAELEKQGGEYYSKTTGWTDCGCGEKFEGGIVLDPFMGAFTTALVAYQNRRNYVGCELSPEYIKLGERRLKDEKEKFGLFENNPCVVPEPMVSLDETVFFKE